MDSKKKGTGKFSLVLSYIIALGLERDSYNPFPLILNPPNPPILNPPNIVPICNKGEALFFFGGGGGLVLGGRD